MRDARRNGELKVYWLNKITVPATITIAFCLSEKKIQTRTKILNKNRYKFGEGYQLKLFQIYDLGGE